MQVNKTKVVDSDYYYWKQVEVAMKQFSGVAQGYADHCDEGKELDFNQVYMLTNMGDLEDLLSAFSAISPLQSQKKMMDCSGLVRLLPDRSNIFVGQTTFNGYAYMLRVFKHFKLNLHNPMNHGQTMSFSARPGDLESKDDYYIMSSGLSVIETSLAIFNKELYQRLSPQTVPNWIRLTVANRMATSAKHWTEIFSVHNSGTHNNQWLILDYSIFKPHVAKLKPNTLMLLEQIPGYIESADMTTFLETEGYFPSYNIPYFRDVFNVTGYAAHNYSYRNDPRAKMFKAYHSSVHTLEDMKYFMNSNDYHHDPFSQNDPCFAISARCDLLSSGPYAFGGIDSKVIDYANAMQMRTMAISGPTHQTVPAFEWNSQFDDVPHLGMPKRWDFDWQTMTPNHM